MLEILNLEPWRYSEKAKSILKKIGRYTELKNQKEIKYLNKEKFHILILRFGYEINKSFLEKFKNLKFILCNATNSLHIDQNECKKRKIKIINLKNEKKFLPKITSTAELIIGLIISLYRHIPNSFLSVKENKWNRYMFVGRVLYKKKIGIVGMGRVGKLVAHYAKNFSMDILYYDKNSVKLNFFAERFKNLKKLLNISDVVVISLDLNKDTYKIFDYRYFKSMKKDAIFINASRGEIICENGLLRALKKKIISGAAIDVLTNENNLNFKKNKLLNYLSISKNLIITPHIGGATFETWKLTEEFIVKKFLKYIK